MIGRTNVLIKKTPAPTPEVGDIVYLANQKCIYIGNNRYLCVEDDGYGVTKLNWDAAKQQALINAGAMWDISRAYNLSNQGLMTKAEAEALPDSVILTIQNIIKAKHSEYLSQWLNEEYEYNTRNAYTVSIASGGKKSIGNNRKTYAYIYIPAFTVVSKK